MNNVEVQGAKSDLRGHPLVYNNGSWVYVDTGLPMDNKRPCVNCEKEPKPLGFDGCIGYIPGISHACCGHGKEDAYIIWFDNKKCKFMKVTFKIREAVVYV